MNVRLISTFAAVVAIAGLAACGGGDSDDATRDGIRTQKGLAVALASGNLGATGEEDAAAPAPASDLAGVDRQAGGAAGRDSAIGYGGGFAPDKQLAPVLQEGGNGLSVQGFGSASADADSAIAEFYFGTNQGVIEPVPFPEGRSDSGTSSGSSGAAPAELQEVDPITEADLQPVIDALVGAGVSRDDIEFLGQPYYDKFFASATLRATIKNLDSLDATITAATNAASGLQGTTLQNTNVSYTVSDCAALELAALEAAVDDASERATTFANALGVQIGNVTGASNYSYFGGTPCGNDFGGPYPLPGVPYAAGGSREVQVIANIAVTYALQ